MKAELQGDAGEEAGTASDEGLDCDGDCRRFACERHEKMRQKFNTYRYSWEVAVMKVTGCGRVEMVRLGETCQCQVARVQGRRFGQQGKVERLPLGFR